jgi:glyoxylase-like metal-dependent hydrolase (beta-lactamase superfamily II)
MVAEQLIFLPDMLIQRIPNTPVDSNCFVLHELQSKECLIIDPGSEDNTELMSYLSQNELIPSTVILTHEHFDHIWGVVGLSNYFTIDLICNRACATAIASPKKNLSIFHNQVGFSISGQIKTTEELNHEFFWQGKFLRFIQTPGHSEGSMSIQLDEMLFCGDLMIQGKKTITKLPGGSIDKLKKTLSFLKSELSPGTIIHSGHGESFPLQKYFLYNQL